MDYMNYSIEYIFMDNGGDDTEVESESLWETGVEGTSIMNPPPQSLICVP